MKILHLTDLHGNRRWFRWLVGHAAGHDLVCVTGDLINQSSDVGWVSRTLGGLGAPLAVCSGNHDDADVSWVQDRRLRSETWLDGDAFNLSGVSFRCLAWNEPIPSRCAVGEVWLSHAPPAGCRPARTYYGIDYGDFELGEVCRRGHAPDIVLCGHVHEPAAWCDGCGESLVFNPGKDSAMHPPHIVLDLRKGLAIRNPYAGKSETLQHRNLQQVPPEQGRQGNRRSTSAE